MSKVKLDIVRKGGNLYYTDTDSIVTDIVLDEKSVGTELGQFKLEHKVKRGYFISNKTYCLKLFKKIYDKDLDDYIDTIIKSKSVDRKLLTLDDFKDLYNGISIKATKRFAKTDHSKGSVIIEENPDVTLNHDSFTKREKLFKRSKWFDTKPLVLKSSMVEVKPRKTIKPRETDKLDKVSKKSKSVKPSESLLIASTVKRDNVKRDNIKNGKFDMLKYLPIFVNNKVYNYLPTFVNKKVYYYFISVYRCLSNIFHYVSMILFYFLTILGSILAVLF
jgi:hypothetical protein